MAPVSLPSFPSLKSAEPSIVVARENSWTPSLVTRTSRAAEPLPTPSSASPLAVMAA